MLFRYCIGNFARNFRSNKVKLPWAVRICEAKATKGEATFLMCRKISQKYFLSKIRQISQIGNANI